MRHVCLLLAFVAMCSSTLAQLVSPNTPGSITGTVVDPTGAVIPHASITVSSTGAAPQFSTADDVGHFSITNLAPGAYDIEAQAPGFQTGHKQSVHVATGAPARLILTLAIQTDQQQVIVTDSGLDTSPENNGGSIVLKGDTLRSLSDDPDELQTQLQAIAGSDPETGTQFYVDGFSSTKLPPKSAIRDIRINQNPYSAQYDALGFGRIEIRTKPGADKLHAEYWMQGNDSPWNARIPFVSSQPPYYSWQLDSDVNGPIRKIASHFTSIYAHDSVNDAIVNAVVLGPTFNPTAFTQAVSSTSSEVDLSTRVDLQWGKVQTLSLRYQLSRDASTNAGVGQFELASQANNNTSVEQSVQFSDEQTYGTKVVNETRFQYIRDRAKTTPFSFDPTIAVQGAFTGGGNNTGINRDAQDHYELQDYMHIAIGPHDLNVGARLRAMRDSNFSTANFNGQFTFQSISAYQITVQGLANDLSPAAIRAAGGGASLFTQTQGTPNIAVTMADVGLFAEDNWKVRKEVTFSYGMRFEAQTSISDHADFAPRAGLSWAIPGGKDKPPIAVIRGGYGLFYQRFNSTGLLQAERQNGVTEREFAVTDPDFYPSLCSTDPVACASDAQNSPTIYQISPTLRAPYVMIGGIGGDKPIGKHVNLSVNYMNSRGEHLFLTRNINAPLPGTYIVGDPTSGTRPLGTDQNIYQYDSEGASGRNRLVLNGNIQAKRAGFFGYYMLSKTKTNTSGLASFPSNQYDLRLDYGRGSYDIRNRAFLGGFTHLPGRLSLNPFFIFQSSAPFNIVVGQDLNGDTQFNDRPAFATDLTRPSVYVTRWGTFDASPLPGQRIIPVNYGKGPGMFIANVRLIRHFNFGPAVPEDPAPTAPGAAPAVASGAAAKPAAKPAEKSPAKPEKKEIERRYTLDFAVSANNIFNHPNYAQPVGVLGSPLFGTSTALASNFGAGSTSRIINFATSFRF